MELLTINNNKYNKLSKSFLTRSTPKEVLLVDDDESFRYLLKSVAESEAVKITAHDSLRELTSPKEIKKFDLVILDYLMDRFTGLQTAKYIDTFFPELPVIMISGNSHFGPDESWPNCIKQFLSKELGVYGMARQVQQFLT